MGALNTHEDFSAHSEVKPPSERAFGLTMAVVFAVIGLWPLRHGGQFQEWILAVAVAFALDALIWPSSLRWLNRGWMYIGRVLDRITNPLITGAVFFLVITPIALIRRLVKKDSLGVRFDPAAESYWIERRPPGPAPESMRQQF